MSNTIFGFNLIALLMSLSGVFYFVCAVFIWKKVKENNNELVNAFFVFLLYQTVNMLFMGIEIQTKNIVFSNISAFSVLIGSAYMLKFPFSSFSEKVRKSIFVFSLLIVLSIFVWFMQSIEQQMALMKFTLWYDLVINGLIVGGFMIILAIRTAEQKLKAKAIGGGTGVLSCCVVANGATLAGSMLAGSLFGFLAPIFILGSFVFSRKIEQSEKIMSA